MVWWILGAALAQEPPPVDVVAPLVEPVVQAPVSPPAPKLHAQRDTYDAAGHVIRHLELIDGVLVSEAASQWDESGHLVQRDTVAGQQRTVEKWTYASNGQVATVVTETNGVISRSESWTYAGDKPLSHKVDADGRTETTTWTWDTYGTATLIETRDGQGNLLAQTVGDRPPPPFIAAGLAFGATAGLAYNSDVRLTELTLGFTFDRDPKPGTYARDPLEVSAGGVYKLARSAGKLTNQYTNLRFGLDYNAIVPHTTLFLFADVERNPVANLNIDLELAPLGIKYDIRDAPQGFTSDVSFAPVWNYRSILVPAGGDCEGEMSTIDVDCNFSRARGSFRARLGYAKGVLKVGDTIEFLPTLNPEEGTVIDAVDTEAIVRNTLKFKVQLTKRWSFEESFILTRDPLLARQVDCDADPESLLCDGLSIQSGTAIGLTYVFVPKP